MLPGYTHNIINLSDTEDLITVMWANEIFDPETRYLLRAGCKGRMQTTSFILERIIEYDTNYDFSNVSFKDNGKLKRLS